MIYTRASVYRTIVTEVVPGGRRGRERKLVRGQRYTELVRSPLRWSRRMWGGRLDDAESDGTRRSVDLFCVLDLPRRHRATPH